jgi:transposase
MMILELHRQGLSITAIARRTGRDPKTVRKYIERGLEPPFTGPARLAARISLHPISTTSANDWKPFLI